MAFTPFPYQEAWGSYLLGGGLDAGAVRGRPAQTPHPIPDGIGWINQTDRGKKGSKIFKLCAVISKSDILLGPSSPRDMS